MPWGQTVVDRTVAQRYAEAFVGTLTSGRKGALSLSSSERLKAGLEELKVTAETYTASRALRRFLDSPEIALKEKAGLFKKVWSEGIGAETQQLLGLLLKRRRMDHLPEIAEEAIRISRLRQGTLRGEVTTAHPISNAETDAIAEGLTKRLGQEVVLERSVEGEILGGVRVRIGTTLLDGSIQRRLNDLREHLKSIKVKA